jgi:hypothetical protein
MWTRSRIQLVKRLLGPAEVALLLASLLALVGLLVRRGPATAAALPDRPVEGDSASSSSELPPIEEFAAIWERDFRQVLIEPPPKPPAKPEPPPPPPAPVKLPKLVATFIEQDGSWAVFVDGKEGMRVRGPAERIDEFEVVEITPGAARLRKGGTDYEVKVAKPASGPQQDRKSKSRRG